jgi:hypothetical protein
MPFRRRKAFSLYFDKIPVYTVLPSYAKSELWSSFFDFSFPAPEVGSYP